MKTACKTDGYFSMAAANVTNSLKSLGAVTEQDQLVSQTDDPKKDGAPAGITRYTEGHIAVQAAGVSGPKLAPD